MYEYVENNGLVPGLFSEAALATYVRVQLILVGFAQTAVAKGFSAESGHMLSVLIRFFAPQRISFLVPYRFFVPQGIGFLVLNGFSVPQRIRLLVLNRFFSAPRIGFLMLNRFVLAIYIYIYIYNV